MLKTTNLENEKFRTMEEFRIIFKSKYIYFKIKKGGSKRQNKWLKIKSYGLNNIGYERINP